MLLLLYDEVQKIPPSFQKRKEDGKHLMLGKPVVKDAADFIDPIFERV